MMQCLISGISLQRKTGQYNNSSLFGFRLKPLLFVQVNQYSFQNNKCSKIELTRIDVM